MWMSVNVDKQLTELINALVFNKHGFIQLFFFFFIIIIIILIPLSSFEKEKVLVQYIIS